MTCSAGDPAGLPGAWYCEGAPFQQERRTIFVTQWQLLGPTSQLTRPGDFVTANLGGWPVFALVDAHGAIGAFRNVCRHQGMQVLEKPRGRCESLRCRYHGWTYDFSGRMIAAPELVAPADARSDDNHLCRIASGAWHGLLFVNLDRDAQPLDAALRDVAATVDASLARYAQSAGEVVTDLNCNWKTYVEHCVTSRRLGAPDADGTTWQWQWPLAMVRSATEAISVYQIIPRTFARSRVVEHVFVVDSTDAAPTAAAIDAARQRAAVDKVACEALQRERETGATDADSRLAVLHQYIREAHASAPRENTLRLQQGAA